MTTPASKRITPNDYAKAASDLGVPLAAIYAVTDVESSGNGFYSDGRPVILFERHVMRRQLISNGKQDLAEKFTTIKPEIVNSKAGGYKGGIAECDRLDAAAKIDRQSALESASWGLFQIMGFHWKTLQYQSIQDFVNAMYKSEGAQLDAFVRFIKANPSLLNALRKQDWRAFAKGYNGPAYEKNNYHTKMADAFFRRSKEFA